MVGFRTSARPIATRCISPPDKAVALFSSLWLIRTIFAISSTRLATVSSERPDTGERSGKLRLSRTVRCGYSEYCWKTNATSRSAGCDFVMSRPLIRILPESASSNPAIKRRVVVLPAPEGPNKTTSSPSPMVNSRLLIASVSPKRFCIPWRAISAMSHLRGQCFAITLVKQRGSLSSKIQSH